MRRPEFRDDRGAVMVELAIISIVLLYLIAGIADFGLAWRDKLTVENATRAGARTASNLGADRSADYNLLQSVKAALADLPRANIHRVVVFPSDSTGTPSSACRTNPLPVVGQTCNVYSADQLFDLTPADFTGSTCSGTAPDRFWCPTGRVTAQATADYLGVWVEIHRDRMTDLLPGQTTIRSTSVMRLEPQGG